MSEKLNRLNIKGAGLISLTNPATTILGFSWTGTELVHRSGKTLRFTPAVTAEISAAVATSRPRRTESKSGAQIVADGDDPKSYTESWIANDAVCMYSRDIPEVTVTVAFSKEEVVG